MKRLLLLRHAKASQTSAAGDHGRTLAPRGRRDAPEMARAMRGRDFLPDLVLCSTAARTRETWALIVPHLGDHARVEFTDALYLASAKTIVSLVRTQGGDAQTVLVVGHNPGLEDCAAALLRPPQSDAERGRGNDLAKKFPTAALAVLDCKIAHWTYLAPGVAAFTDFLKPRDL